MVVLADTITYRKDESITRISIYSSKNKGLSFPWRELSNVVNLPLVLWLVTPGNDAISEAQCWDLVLAELALSSTVAWSAMLSGSSCC